MFPYWINEFPWWNGINDVSILQSIYLHSLKKKVMMRKHSFWFITQYLFNMCIVFFPEVWAVIRLWQKRLLLGVRSFLFVCFMLTLKCDAVIGYGLTREKGWMEFVSTLRILLKCCWIYHWNISMKAEGLVSILITLVTTQKKCHKAIVVFGKMSRHELLVLRITGF